MSQPARLSVVGSAVLTPPELEQFASLLANGKQPAQAYQASGVGVAMACGLPTLMTAELDARVAWLRSQAVPVTGNRRDVRELARQYTAEAIKGLVEIAQDAQAPHSARAMAWQAILDRGHGKPEQKTEIELSVFEGLPPEKRALLDAACELLLERERATIDVSATLINETSAAPRNGSTNGKAIS